MGETEGVLRLSREKFLVGCFAVFSRLMVQS